MVVDGQAGLTGADEEVITWLRRHHPDKPATLAVNKCENSAKADIMVRRRCCWWSFLYAHAIMTAQCCCVCMCVCARGRVFCGLS